MNPAIHRRTIATIDLRAIQNNLKTVKSHLPAQAELWAVVKANAYGHGAVPVAQAVQDLADGFCVSNLDEALELRENEITLPVLVLSGIVPENADLAKAHDLTLAAPSLTWLEQVCQTGKDLTGLKMHIAVDTGMGRIGVTEASEANQMIALMDKYSIKFDGIFTHFATADEKDLTQFNRQRAKFDQLLSDLTRQPHYIHSANSATGIWHSDKVMSIERLGLGLYGANPSGETLELPYELEPALSLTSELTHVKKIRKNDTVGYGATFVAAEEMYVGTLPIGYADGWNRDMQGFSVLIDGKFCEIIGRVSMDQMVVKLEKNVPIGTKVTLIGENNNKKISVQDIGNWKNTIAYEVLCGLSDRIYRQYIK